MNTLEIERDWNIIEGKTKQKHVEGNHDNGNDQQQPDRPARSDSI
jgi:hypothetical protein